MRRFPKIANRIGLAGVVALVAGSLMIVGAQAAFTGSAPVGTSGFELFCANTPIGNLVFNDVVITGTLSPASPSPGQQFNLDGFQTQVPVPASVVQEAAAAGNASISGTASTTIAATGATPSSMSTGALAYDQPIPSPVPPSGLTLDVPTAPATIGPFTSASSDISLALGSSISLTFNDVAITAASFDCSAYPNNVMASGLTQGIPPGLPISPVIAAAGSSTTSTTSPTSAVTGPYELYCPHTPVGDLDFNDVTTSATISPDTLAAGDQFQVTGYQTDIPVPSGLVAAAVGLDNSSFDGLAASDVDAYGATPPQVATGSMGFDLPIPDPVPSSALPLDIPSSPTTVGPFTASGGPITIAQDQSILVVAKLSSKAFTMLCDAYPNDSIATSGSTGTAPSTTPIRPIITTAAASGTPVTTTTTTVPPGGGSQTPGAPYELYCPGTPVGDIAINDVVTTGSFAPSSLNEGDQFQVTNVQTQFTIPQAVAQQAENLGLTTLSGDLLFFLDVTGTEYDGYDPGTSVGSGAGATPTTVAATATPGTSPTTTTIVGPAPPPYPFPGEVDLSFDVTLPSPVPSTGVQFTATPAPGSEPETFVAAGGPIQVFVSGANLNVSAFGDQFGLFCDTLVNDTVPTGLSIQEPETGYIEPLVTTGSATSNPPPPTPPGATGPYELFCPGTPVGDVALNDINTAGTITPADPAPGEQFNLTGYQTTLTIPASIASAAAALGNTALIGTATGSVDAIGATPAQISTGSMDFDVALPSPIPEGGVTLTVPSTVGTVGPFNASGGTITIAEDASIQLVLVISGAGLTLDCSAYANDAAPTGIVTSFPPGSPMSPVIATTSSSGPPTTVPTTTPPESGEGSATTQPAAPVAASTGSSSSASPNTSANGGTAGSAASTVSASGADASVEQGAVTGDSGSPSPLAFTGSGTGTVAVALVGAAFVLLGLSMLALADIPRRMGRWLVRGSGSQSNQRDGSANG
ncbi:MAG TPA: hypothetical protein VED63_01975 [Acidimicrobiales bacterium]|nr:hypothetical protein [Acidimicrobiales bacterium]